MKSLFEKIKQNASDFFTNTPVTTLVGLLQHNLLKDC